jgi:hypothetical protein
LYMNRATTLPQNGNLLQAVFFYPLVLDRLTENFNK